MVEITVGIWRKINVQTKYYTFETIVYSVYIQIMNLKGKIQLFVYTRPKTNLSRAVLMGRSGKGKQSIFLLWP
jgi:hypothetical protein